MHPCAFGAEGTNGEGYIEFVSFSDLQLDFSIPIHSQCASVLYELVQARTPSADDFNKDECRELYKDGLITRTRKLTLNAFLSFFPVDPNQSQSLTFVSDVHL